MADIDDKIRVTAKHSLKRGAYLIVYDYDTNKRIAHIGRGQRDIVEGLSADKRASVQFIFDNFNAILNMDIIDPTFIKLNLRVPKELKSAMQIAFDTAEKNQLTFRPARAMIQALISEISRVLTLAGVEVELPKFRNMHDVARLLFTKLTEKSDKPTGFFNLYTKAAETYFNKPPEKIELGHLHKYKEDTARPPLWGYACALIALHKMKKNIFEIGLPEEQIFAIWHGANKSELKDAEIVDRFNRIFKPSSAILEALATYLKNQPH